MDEIDLLSGFRQPSDGEDVDSERAAAVWAAVARRLEKRSELPRLRPSARARTHHLRWAAAVGAVLALAIMLPTLLPGQGPGGADPAAADALYRAARVALDQPPEPAPEPGQYAYTRISEIGTQLYVPGHGLDNFLFSYPSTRETWIGPDGSGRGVTVSGEVAFPTEADRAAWVGAGSPELGGGERIDETYEPGEAYYRDFSQLPTDPKELLRVIEEREVVGGDEADWVTFQIIGELLREPYASPKHRAALYEVAANFPGVEYVGNALDPAGRPAIAVSYTGGGHRQVLMFDPRTSRIVGERWILLDQEEAGLSIGPDTWPGTIYGGAGPPGTETYSMVYLESGIVDSTRERPPATEELA